MAKVKLILFPLLAALVVGCTADDTDDSQQGEQNGSNQEETTDQGNEKQNENQDEQSSDKSDGEKDDEQQDETQKDQGNQNLTKKDAEAVLQEYKETFTIKTADDGTVKNFDTKQEIVMHYQQIMSEDLAESYVDQYYNNKDGKLKIVATEQPYWLNPEKDFKLEKKESAYQVIQQHKSELRGNREFTFVLTPADSDSQWVVSDVKSKEL